jgi:hypothetical protein
MTDIDMVRGLVPLSGMAAIIWALAPLVKATGHAVAEVMTAKAALHLSKAVPPPVLEPDHPGQERGPAEGQAERTERTST